MKKAILLLSFILSVFSVCSCKSVSFQDEQIIDDSLTDFKYEYVEPLAENVVVNQEQNYMTANQVFAASGYFVRGTITSLKELKMTHKQFGETQTSYATIAEMDVKKNYGSNPLTFEHDNAITFVYMVCSRQYCNDYVKLQEGNEYLLLLNDTVKCSPREGLEEYGRYTSLYSKYSVIEKTEKGYDANAFMVNILGLEEQDSWTLKEIKTAVEPYLDKLAGMSVLEALKQN